MQTVRSADGTTIAFHRTGEGPSLVLVVGAFSDRSSTRSLAAGLAARFTVYEYDRRGRGDSGDTAPYSVEREVEDLAAVVDAAGEPAYLFGHSSGAALTLEAAARGMGVRGLAVYEPPYTAGVSAALADDLAVLAASGRQSEATERFLALVGTPTEVVDQMKAGPYWEHMESFAGTLPYEVRLCNDGSVPVDRLGGITAPTLVLAGGESPDWAREVARDVAAAVPGAEQRVLGGQGHGASDEVLVPLLTAFFAGGSSAM